MTAIHIGSTRALAALALAALTAPAALIVTAAPIAAQPGTNVNGWNVGFVAMAGGHYAQLADGSWAEYDRNGRIAFRFTEMQRDEWSVYLHDTSRNVQLQLDLFRRKISYGQIGGSRSDLYDITGAGPGASPYRPAPPPVVRRTRNVNAGPIWNQQDALVKCPVAAFAVGGTWTGAWRTTIEGQMSVCEIAF